MNEPLAFLDVKGLAALLNIAPKTIRNWVFLRQIPYFKLNGLVRFNRKEIAEWYEARRMPVLREPLERLKISTP